MPRLNQLPALLFALSLTTASSSALAQEHPILYVDPNDGHSSQAKAWLRLNDISFEEKPLDKSENVAALKRYKGVAVPLLVWRGRALYGFTSQAYARFFSSK